MNPHYEELVHNPVAATPPADGLPVAISDQPYAFVGTVKKHIILQDRRTGRSFCVAGRNSTERCQVQADNRSDVRATCHEAGICQYTGYMHLFDPSGREIKWPEVCDSSVVASSKREGGAL